MIAVCKPDAEMCLHCSDNKLGLGSEIYDFAVNPKVRITCSWEGKNGNVSKALLIYALI
jgi:hypothetical protein